jgi:DNA-binding NtrC family response regulator
LCLDEIGELPLELQPYLLRVLEEQVVYRLGDSKPRPVDVRLVALTNRNLKQEVAAGRFRRDLYFRIGAATITIPPLRARLADLPLLVEHFNQLFAARYGLAPLRLEPAALSAFADYGWPGNIRELRNLIESLTLMSTDRIVRLADLPPDLTEPDAVLDEPPPMPAASWQAPPDRPAAAPVSLEAGERQLISQALERCGGNFSKAAAALGISRSTLYRKLRHYGLPR